MRDRVPIHGSRITFRRIEQNENEEMAVLAYDSNAVRSHGVSRVSGSVSFFE